jgi:hypothetical protein
MHTFHSDRHLASASNGKSLFGNLRGSQRHTVNIRQIFDERFDPGYSLSRRRHHHIVGINGRQFAVGKVRETVEHRQHYDHGCGSHSYCRK